MIAVGDVLNETFEVIREIGQGGTGIVYLAGSQPSTTWPITGGCRSRW